MSERHKMNKGWLELESDPGLFTLLLEDFGVKGVQVEEIYDLQKPFEGQVYGFIFLFKWIEERRSRRKLTQEEESLVMDDKVVNSMFFAKQVIPNSCATHALLSVMLNSEHFRLGDTLADLKKFTADMNPEDKGYAIGNMPDLARAHNSHARPEPNMLPEKQQGISAVRTMEAFHFVSYVPVNGHLFELDGLKPYPIDHGPWSEKENWTEKFRRVISERLGMATGGEPYHDIRFNLMAVVPDRREQYQRKLEILKTNRHIVLEALQRLLDPQMVKVTNPSIHNDPTATSRSVKQIKAEPIITRSVAAAVREATAAAANEKPLASFERSTKLGSRSTRASHKSSGFDDLATSDILIPSDVAEVTTETASSTPVRLPPELDSHNYAKSPDMELMDTGSQASEDGSVNVDGSDDDSDVDADNDGEEHSLARQTQLQVTQEGPLKMKISLAGGPHVSSVTALPRTPVPPPGANASTDSGDVTKPLTVQTKFNDGSPGPSSSSTDTASEVGSFLNSPTNSLNASSEPSPGTSPGSKPGLDISLEQQYELAEAPLNVKTEDIQQLMDISASVSQMQAGQTDGVSAVSLQSAGPEGTKVLDIEKKKSQHKGFSPKDLVALLKNIEQEIKTCDTNLHDEIEKRRKYQMDDCRRTHNYDQFICMFLSMLAEQGHLGELVEEHMLVKRRQGVNVGSLHKAARPERRRRSRPKKRR